MTTNLQTSRTSLQQTTHLQQQTQLQPTFEQSIPPALDQALQQKLLESAAQLGREMSPQLLQAVMASVVIHMQQHPDALKTLLANYMPEPDATQWAATLLQRVTHIQPPGVATVAGQYAAPSLGQSTSTGVIPGAIDPFLFEQTVKFFQQVGVEDPETALDWARHVHGLPTSRPLEQAEIDEISRLMKAQDIEDYIEPSATELQKQSRLSRLVPQRLDLLSNESPLVLVMVYLLIAASLWAAFQAGRFAERRTANDRVQRAVEWANCVVQNGAAAPCLK